MQICPFFFFFFFFFFDNLLKLPRAEKLNYLELTGRLMQYKYILTLILKKKYYVS